MRNRNEIMKSLAGDAQVTAQVQLEVLLDIRDLLMEQQERPPFTFSHRGICQHKWIGEDGPRGVRSAICANCGMTASV
jgi:hypothetical protein